VKLPENGQTLDRCIDIRPREGRELDYGNSCGGEIQYYLNNTIRRKTFLVKAKI